MKIDLHLHSKHSKRPSQWVLQKIGCPESFTDPLALHRITKKKGMSGMTLTDHNTINGCLEIAHLPDAFISEEVTTYFPEDRCKVHLLVFNIDEAVHQDIQKIRENIFDLAVYLNKNKIVHALAHPLFSVNDRLTLGHFEKLLLLFKTFELNGARDQNQNMVLKAVLEGLSQRDIENLADQHGLQPCFNQPWKKNQIGGSDDHSSLNIARMWTEVPGAKNLNEFLEGINTGRSRPQGRGSGPRTLAHNLYGIAYQFYNHRFNLDRYSHRDFLMRFLDRMLRPEARSQTSFFLILKGFWGPRQSNRFGAKEKVQDVLRREGERAVINDPDLMTILKSGRQEHRDSEEIWFRFVSQVCNKVLHHFGENLIGRLSGVNFFSIFDSIGAAASLYSIMAPYFVSFGLFGRDRLLIEQVQNRFREPVPGLNLKENSIKVAHFTDTLYEINGVALTLLQQAKTALAAGKDLTVITCARNQSPPFDNVRNFKPVSVYELPEYPEQKLFLPPFLEMLNHVYEMGYNYIHSATPGPVGLAALAIARILGLPISGTYHTAIPQYAARLTGDEAVEQLLWRYTLWYYDQMEFIYVPSGDIGDELAAKGLNPAKIRLYPRGVDIETFHPAHRNGFFDRRYNLGRKIKLLYVGRVSKEKNLPLLVEVFRELSRVVPEVHLIVVGDGPYLETMKEELAGRPVTFTGYLQGRDLAEAYASADLFVFPSTTDTFGNVVLEAQASGLPVIVADFGGPRENVLPGQTGIVVPSNDPESLVQAMHDLAVDPFRREQMSRAARKFMESRSFERAFLKHWQIYTHGLEVDCPEPMAKAG